MGLSKRDNERAGTAAEISGFLDAGLGVTGMLICYDLLVAETARCLALQGADWILFPTMGGAATDGDDIGVPALRVRAAETFTWLAVAFFDHV